MCQRKLFERQKFNQESLGTHFAETNHNGDADWEVRLIDQTDNIVKIRKRKSFWQYELGTFQPNELNECEMTLL